MAAGADAGEQAPKGQSSVRQQLAATALVGAGLTLAVVALPFVRFAYRAPTLHVVIETLNAFIAVLVAYLVYGRYRELQRAQDLLLGLGLVTVAVANLILTAVPLATVGVTGEELTNWTPLGVRLLGTVFLVWAAVTPARVRVPQRPAAMLAAGVVVVLLAISVIGMSLGHLLPAAVDPDADLTQATRPVLDTHPVVVGVHAAGVVLYAVAAVAFGRQASSRQDELLRWLASGCVLASFGWVHYLLFPSLYSDFVYTGDLLRLGFYALMLLGAAREIRSYWDARARAAVLEDRRRMARDLHDGLAQELAYITAQTQHLEARPADPVALHRLQGAASRALDEARQAIAALSQPVDEPFDTLLRQTVDSLAARYDVSIGTDVDGAPALTLERREALLRITAEAVRNAVRHGGAQRIDVILTGDPLRLTVSDDGCGFDVEATRCAGTDGFGLTSMTERADAVGGQLRIQSSTGEGTRVVVEMA